MKFTKLVEISAHYPSTAMPLPALHAPDTGRRHMAEFEYQAALPLMRAIREVKRTGLVVDVHGKMHYFVPYVHQVLGGVTRTHISPTASHPNTVVPCQLACDSSEGDKMTSCKGSWNTKRYCRARWIHFNNQLR